MKMKILWGEIRRYLRPVPLAAAGLLLVCWCVLFDGAFDRPRWRDWGLLSVEYRQRFGDVIDRDELEIIKQDYDDLRAQLDLLIEESMGAYDVHSLEDLWLLDNADFYRQTGDEAYQTAVERWGEENLDELQRQCYDLYWNGSFERLAWREQDIRRVIETFDFLNDEYVEAVRTNDPEWGFQLSEYQKKRIITDIQSGAFSVINTVMDEMGENFRDSFHYYAVLIFILCALFTVPFLTTNRITGVQAMQLASRCGKGLLSKQLGAALVISAAVNLIIDAFFYLAYFYYQPDERHYLLSCPLNAGAARNQFWLDLTYGQYVFLIFLKVLLLSLALTCGLFIISYFSKNYINAMAAAVLSVVLMAKLSKQLGYHVYLEQNAAWEYPLMLLPLVAAVLGATVIFLRRIRQEDYL